jgi:aspartate aminotransferase
MRHKVDIQLSNRINQVKPSPTLAVTQRAAEMRAQGKDIIGLGVGEPDFDTPEHIKEAAIKAMKEGKTKYTAVDGIPSLKEAIQIKFKEFNKLDFKTNEIIVSTGAKQCIYNLLQAIVNPDDQVIIPAPYWVSYPDMVKLADGIPVIVEADMKQNFKITASQLDTHITPRTKLVIFNSPSNPSGMAYTLQEWKEIGEVLRKHPHVTIMTDDMYEHILWSKEPFSNILNACPDLQDRTIVISGVSKAYAMTGWRIGYAAGPESIIKAIKKIQGQSTSNPCSISQAAAEAALRGPQDEVSKMVEAFKARHDFVVAGLNDIPGIQCSNSDGTFYAFPSVKKAISKLNNIQTDSEFAEFLITEAGVALVPGSAFGTPGHIRLSFATSKTVLEDALSRIRKVLT